MDGGPEVLYVNQTEKGKPGRFRYEKLPPARTLMRRLTHPRGKRDTPLSVGSSSTLAARLLYGASPAAIADKVLPFSCSDRKRKLADTENLQNPVDTANTESPPPTT